MYVIGSGEDSVYQFTLTPGFDLSTATYDSISFNVSSEDTTPTSIAFNSDGTKMFIVGDSSDSVYQYSLSLGFDLSTATYDSISFNVSSQETVVTGVAFNSDGTKMFIVGESSDTVYLYSLSPGFDLSTASYSSTGFNVSSQDTLPQSVAFNPDGTQMYIVGNNNDAIHQYTLETGYDFTPLTSYDSVSFNVGPTERSRELFFNSAGTKMFVVGELSNNVSQYTLSTPFDLTTASLDSLLDVVSGPQDVFFNPTGTKMFIAQVSTIHQYTLSSGFDISTASKDVETLSVSAQGSMRSIYFSSSGNRLYALASSNAVFEYILTSAFDLSTATYSGSSFSVNDETTFAHGMTFDANGNNMYVIDSSAARLLQYSLTEEFDLSTASYSGVSTGLGSVTSSPRGLHFDITAGYIFVLAFSPQAIFRFLRITSEKFIIGSDTLSVNDLGKTIEALNGIAVLTTVDGEFVESVPYDFGTATPGNWSMYRLVTDQTDGVRFSGTGATQVIGTAAAVTNTGGQIDTTYWTDTNSMTATQNGAIDDIEYAVSTDNRNTWMIRIIGLGSRSIARNNAGTWEYNTGASYGDVNWVTAPENNEFSALEEAVKFGTVNKMNKTQLEALGDTDQFALTQTLDLAIILTRASDATDPTSDGVVVNYDAQAIKQGAIHGTDYLWDHPEPNKVRLTSLHEQSLRIRVF